MMKGTSIWQATCRGAQAAIFLAVLALTMTSRLTSTGKVTASEPNWKIAKLPIKPADVDGFTATVEVLNAASEGYMPLRITATAVLGTFPGDRPISISIVPRYGSQPKPKTTYRASFVLPAGNVSTSTTIHIPKYFEGGSFNVSLSDSNGSLESYVASFNVSVPSTVQGPEQLISVSDWLTRIAVILPAPSEATDEAWARVPDFRSLESMVSVDANFVTNPQRQDNNTARTYLEVQARSAAQLLTSNTAHQSWLGYESVDVILVALPTLESMKRNHPERFKAVRDWVSCGGVVWTYAVPDSMTLADVFDVAPSLRLSNSRFVSIDPLEKALAGYTPGNRSTTLEVVMDPYNYANRFGSGQSSTRDPVEQFRTPPANPGGLVQGGLRGMQGVSGMPGGGEPHPFLVEKSLDEYRDEIDRLPVEAGIVIGLRTADPFPGSLEQWFVVKDLSGANQVWRHRRGVSIARGSSQFWDWLMNNVARPPVYAFLALLSGFVLLVGPISYHFTRRAGRGYLMFIIAPVLASVTTLLLFGYGFIADGFGTKARIRQITWVDGTSGRASEMNRATYFAAFRPDTGLRFPIDAAVYPVVNTDEMIEFDYGPTLRFDRTIELTEEQQIFRGEFLPSRTQSQFLSYRPLDRPVGLTVKYQSGQWNLTNQFDRTLTFSAIRMPDSTYCMLEKPLASGESIVLDSVSDSVAMVAMRELYIKDRPEPPLGYTPSSNNTNGNWYRLSTASSILTNLNPSWTNTSDELGLYEARLQDILSDKNDLPKNWFVGTLEISDDASAVPGASISESVHYAIGTITVEGPVPAAAPSAAANDVSEDEISNDDQPAAGGENEL